MCLHKLKVLYIEIVCIYAVSRTVSMLVHVADYRHRILNMNHFRKLGDLSNWRNLEI